MDSCLAQIAASDAIVRDPYFQNGWFKTDMSSIAECDGVTQLIPNKVFVPNLFPNINNLNSEFTITYKPVQDQRAGLNRLLGKEFRPLVIYLPQVNYDVDTLITMMNNQIAAQLLSANFVSRTINTEDPWTQFVMADGDAYHETFKACATWEMDVSRNYINLNNRSGPFSNTIGHVNITLNSSLEFFDTVGFHPIYQTDPVDPNSERKLVAQRDADYNYSYQNKIGGPPTNFTEELQDTVPSMQGISIVHVSIKNVCAGNMVTSDSSNTHTNVFLTVSLADTPYGAYACGDFAGAVKVGDVQYTTKMSMSDIEVRLFDHKFRQLRVPSNHDVVLIVKMFYRS
jgi:hypothetical protein